MHLVITPTTFIDLAINGLEYSLSLSNTFSVFSFILVASQVKGKSQPFPTAFFKHALVAEPIFEEHIADPMHLPLSIDLTIVNITIVNTFYSVYSLN